MALEQYYFLFGIGILWTIFAVVQDLKKKEVANWLNFSLIAIALAYRAFYSIHVSDYWFFVYGLIGFAVFYIFGMIFYYGRVFAGGDAKLLMGFGALIPISSLNGIWTESVGFILVLFLGGAVYSLIYSFGLAIKNKEKFSREFSGKIKVEKMFFAIIVLLLIILFVFSDFNIFNLILGILIAFLPFLYAYVTALDKCMEKFVKPKDLTEGDWIVNDIKVGNKTIRKSVHGLSVRDIEFLKKNAKKVLIREGVPFTPAFLIAILFMVFFYLFLSQNFERILAFLF